MTCTPERVGQPAQDGAIFLRDGSIGAASVGLVGLVGLREPPAQGFVAPVGARYVNSCLPLWAGERLKPYLTLAAADSQLVRQRSRVCANSGERPLERLCEPIIFLFVPSALPLACFLLAPAELVALRRAIDWQQFFSDSSAFA